LGKRIKNRVPYKNSDAPEQNHRLKIDVRLRILYLIFIILERRVT